MLIPCNQWGTISGPSFRHRSLLMQSNPILWTGTCLPCKLSLFKQMIIFQGSAINISKEKATERKPVALLKQAVLNKTMNSNSALQGSLPWWLPWESMNTKHNIQSPLCRSNNERFQFTWEHQLFEAALAMKPGSHLQPLLQRYYHKALIVLLISQQMLRTSEENLKEFLLVLNQSEEGGEGQERETEITKASWKRLCASQSIHAS